MPALTITSFGYRHDAPPPATVTVDLREILRDPHVSPRLRYLTANDAEVRELVWNTPGATALVADLIALATTLLELATRTGIPTSLAIGCEGGRHRAAAFAMKTHNKFADLGDMVQLVHRDLHRDVVER
jgi:RNase adaptor protein for sRNA GlmZ degradation